MTLKEAKKILEKEGFTLEGPGKPSAVSEAFTKYESPEICEAMQVVCSAGYMIMMYGNVFEARKERLQKEYEQNTKAPGSAENRIKGDLTGNKSIEHCGEPMSGPGEEQPNEGNPALKEAASQFNDALLDEQAKKIGEQNKEITRLLSLVEKKENSISRLYYEKSVLEKENEELKKGEIPAKYFDKALVDEQAEKIKKLEHEKLDILEMASSCKQTVAEHGKKIQGLGKEIARLNKIIHKKNLNIEKLVKQSSRHLDERIKMFGENGDLKKSLRKTESLLHDISEANSRNLDTCFKNEDLIDELKKKLAEKTKLAKKYAKELSDSSLGLCKLEKQLKDKNAVLSDVAEELRLTKIREKNLAKLGLKYVGENEKLKKELANKVVDKIDAQALKSAESALAYKEKVIAEKDEVIADLGNELAATKKELEDANKLVKTVRKYSKEYREYGIEAVKMIRKMAKVIVNEGPVSSEDFKEYRRLANGYSFNPQLPDFSEEEEKKLTAKMVDINAKCMRAARESINDVFESYAAKYAKSTLDELKDKAYESFNAKAHKLGLVGSKDGKGIPDQMIRVDIAEEGGDQSVTIVQCDNGIILSKEEAEIIERCTKNGTELHYSKKDGLTYTNMFGEEMPIRCLRGMFHVFTDEEIENMKK